MNPTRKTSSLSKPEAAGPAQAHRSPAMPAPLLLFYCRRVELDRKFKALAEEAPEAQAA